MALEKLSNQRNFSTYWAAYFLYWLHKHGIGRVVISPGSRSTPLTLGATVIDSLHKYVILDERSAAYTALGMAKAEGIPTALICTSGTAGANYFPAVIEARQSGVPLIVITADRPPNLRSTGANQTIDQLKLFGDQPVWFHDAGLPRRRQKDLARLHQLALQAIEYATDKRGPVHLNFPFSKPLEPTPDFLKQIREMAESGFETGTGIPIPELIRPRSAETDPELPTSLEKIIADSSKPLMIAGTEQPFVRNASAMLGLARKLRCPLIAEAGSQIPAITDGKESETGLLYGYDAILRAETVIEKLRPDLVIRFNFAPISNSVNRALENWSDVPQIHFDYHADWHDPMHTAHYRIPLAHSKITTNNLIELFRGCQSSENWISSWADFSQQFIAQRKEEIENSPNKKFTDGEAFRSLLDRTELPYNNLFLGNSLPVRDIDLFSGDQLDAFTHIYTQRGASGIDGVASSAMGTTMATGEPGLLFVGDLSFFHDTNALLNAPHLETSLTVIVINNGGGSIFRMLPVYESLQKEAFDQFFETPQKASIETLCSAYPSVHYTKLTSSNACRDLDHTKITRKGLNIVECITDPDASMKQRRQLWEHPYE